MKTNILYFTRTNATQAFALELGKKTNQEVYRIKDEEPWFGFKGLMKGLYYSAINKKMVLQYDPAALDADRLVIMSPLWLSGPAPAIKTLLKSIDHDNIYLVMTNHASPIDGPLKSYRKKFSNIRKTYGITLKKNNKDSVISQLISDMSN